jgi:hypothetical protein
MAYASAKLVRIGEEKHRAFFCLKIKKFVFILKKVIHAAAAAAAAGHTHPVNPASKLF